MNRRVLPALLRLVKGTSAVALSVSALAAPVALLDSPAGAVAGVGGGAAYTPGTPVVATITNGTSAAPWNEAQGDPADAPYASQSPGTLWPTYTPGGVATGSGSTAEPNVAVYPSAASGTVVGSSPYPTGVVGTPGPLDGYCGTGNNSTESAGSPVRQPAGTTLPFAPAYFPHVVRNADGSLTGYFDYRPKDADEALVAARSADGGKSWTYEGEALEQNAGYCPTADTNDDGQGHANVITVGGTTDLYTLNRPAGDNPGVGMLVHALTPTPANPLAGLPASEKVGIDPDAFATSGTAVPVTGGTGATISVNQTGGADTLEQLVPGPFVDLTLTPTPNASNIITCTGVTTTTLVGCTSATAGGVTIGANDLIEQVIGLLGTAETIPPGPNNTLGTGGLSSLPVTFTNNQTATTLNNNAPNRVYVDGVAVYCTQANSSPTTKIEDCTTGPGGPSVSASVGDPVTADPIVPATAEQTNGLVAPDGIVGVLPSYPGAPAGSTIVMYTEKILSYYMAGVTSVAGRYSSSTGTSIVFFANPNTTSSLPSSVSPSSPVTVSLADDTKKIVIPVTCTGLTLDSGGVSLESNTSPLTDTLTGCTVPAADSGDSYGTKDQIGSPNATLESPTTLGQTGEGSTNQDKLYKNNEDLTVLRVAYTTDGINFMTAGLDNDGVISGQSGGASTYDDINNPSTTVDPPGGLNSYATAGTTDTTEMRWVGSAGSIITNPDGSYGLFLSGAWSADGDSDAFNQIFYSSSTDGEHWTEPVSVISTDYTFSASVAQDQALANGQDTSLGVSAYYSGRAYGPSVVQNPDGSLTMVFAGYRSPKPILAAGTVMGINTSNQWSVGATDPALYRNIMEVTLSSSTSPGVATQTAVTANPAEPVTGQTVTLSATVSLPSPRTGLPTGTVTFTGAAGSLCSASLSDTSPDTASCTTSYADPTIDTVTAAYGGDNNYAASSGTVLLPVATNVLTQNDPLSGTTTAGTGFTDQLNASGGSGAITFTQTSGAPDVMVTSSGAVSAPGNLDVGTYAAGGTTQDGDGDSGTWSYSLMVTSTALVTTPTQDTTATVTPYSGQLETSGANGSVTYTQTSGGPDLTVSSSGAISSTSPLAAGPYGAGGTDVDGLGDAGTWTFTLNVAGTTLATSPPSDSVAAGTAYRGQLETTGGSGDTTYTQTSGSPQLTVNPSGAITSPADLSVGTYTASGGTLDAFGDSGFWNFSLTVNSTSLVTTPGIDTTTTVTPYQGQLSTSGANGSVTYTQVTGSPDITVSGEGAVSAASPLVAGSYTAGGTDTDALGDTGLWSFTLQVTPTTLETTPTTGSILALEPFSGQLVSSGGAGDITYTTGTSAPGLTVSSTGAVSADGSLPPGQYTDSGTTSDAEDDGGTWSFTLTVNADPVPTVTRVAPDTGPTTGGTHLTIHGKGFVPGATVAIAQGGMTVVDATDVTVVSSTEIMASTGGGAKAGTWNLYVTTAGGINTARAADDFTYVQPQPVVTSVNPNSGPTTGGTSITITGSGFLPGATVEIAQGHGAGAGAVSAVSVVFESPTEIIATTGGGAKAGVWRLFVTTAVGTSKSTEDVTFTYTRTA